MKAVISSRPREFDLMTIRNKNIVQFYHHDGNVQVMDFADGGALAHNIDKIGESREEIAGQISRGLVYLHSIGFVHKKINTYNILLTRNFDAKIAGFGSEHDLDYNEDWMAPELRSDTSKHTEKTDIYALGVIMKKMGEGSKDYMQWMTQCLDANPDIRPLECPIVKVSEGDVVPELGVNTAGKEPLEELKDMARNGEINIAYHLGLVYRAGIDVPPDEDEALKWFMRAANLGMMEAQNTIGDHCRARGHDTAAEYWYSKAAQQGLLEAWSNLGSLFFHYGRYKESFENYHKAASAGDANARYWLGEMYYRGYPQSLQDDKLAFKWFYKAALQGYADAEYSVGYMYQHGRGIPQSYEDAEKWYLAAIEKGHAPAQKGLEIMRRDRAISERDQDFLSTMMFANGGLDFSNVVHTPGSVSGSSHQLTDFIQTIIDECMKTPIHDDSVGSGFDFLLSDTDE